MVKRVIVLISMALMLTACYKYNAPKKPKNLIPKDKMANILIDLRLIQSVSGINKKVLDSHHVKPAQYVYKKHDVDSLQFALSNDYYAFHIADYDEIYTIMKDSIGVLKQKYKDLIDEEAKAKKKADSIKNVEKKLKQLEALKDTVQIKQEGLIKPISSDN